MNLFALTLLLTAQDPTPVPPTPTTPPTTPTKQEHPSPLGPTAATLKAQALRILFDELACEKVIAAAPAIEDHRLATVDERLEASFRHAYCLVVLGNIGEASAIFTGIVQEKIDAHPPFDMEPRVQLLLEAARAEQVKMRVDAEADQRRKRVERVSLKVRPSAELTGGNRAFFYVTVTDPDAVVQSLRLDFRRRAAAPVIPTGITSTVPLAPQGGGEYYALPVVKQSDGSWTGEIPGSYTRSKKGIVIEYFISAFELQGDLITTWGNHGAPKTIEVKAGSSMALDLKANERLSHVTRVGLAAVATPLMTVGMGGIASVLAMGTDKLMFEAEEVQRELFLVALLTPLGATFGTWVAVNSILDAPAALVPVLTTATLASVFAVGVYWVSASPKLKDPAAESALIIAGAGVVLLASSVVPTVLVAWDEPAE